MPTDRQTPTEHLDPEVLGLYLEGRTSPAEREVVESHLAGCADCYEIFVDSAEALNETPSAAAEGAIPLEPRQKAASGSRDRQESARKPWSRAWIGLLPAAAAILAAIWLAGDEFRPSPRETPEFRTLTSVMSDRRPALGRLAGGLPYGPRPDRVRSGESGIEVPARVEAAAASVQSSLQADLRPEARSTIGVARLMTGDADGAARAFEEAAAGDPGSASTHSDLAVAYLQRAVSSESEADLRRALEAADRALKIDPELPEALFNRALVLEQLGRDKEAAAAWQSYLTRDATTDWAEEARHALASLQGRS
jgi:tetratricopeptide (TPR) repeat protein